MTIADQITDPTTPLSEDDLRAIKAAVRRREQRESARGFAIAAAMMRDLPASRSKSSAPPLGPLPIGGVLPD